MKYMIFGLVGYLTLTVVKSFSAFLFRIKVDKFGSFEGKNKSDFLNAFGQPVFVLNPTIDRQDLIWMKDNGNYILHLKFNNESNFIGIDTQLDETKLGVKGILYSLIAKFI